VNLANVLMKIPDATGTVLYPRSAALGEDDAHATTSRVCRHTLFITAALGVAYLVFGPIAIRILYGPRFVGAIRPMLLMLPGIVTMSLYMILTRNFTSRKRQGVNIVAAGVALGMNVGLNCVLIPRWDISGAAISTCVSYSLRDEIGGYVRRARGLVRGLADRSRVCGHDGSPLEADSARAACRSRSFSSSASIPPLRPSSSTAGATTSRPCRRSWRGERSGACGARIRRSRCRRGRR